MDKRPILLVEDNPDDEVLTLRAFKKNLVANSVVVARDGQQAIDYLSATGNELPAVILLDLKLPKVSGLEVLKRVRADARTRRVPVVILTSSKEDSDLIAGYDLGCNSYIRKPVDFDKFVEAAGQLGLYWLVINEPPPSGRR
ncbi:MAG: response regulator [Burkholderiales bacterium]|jgi:two-component system response regulator